MKLVDILARELDRWPEGMSETVGQGHTGYLHGYAGNGHPNCQTSRQIFTICDDYSREKVTRTQWQAAVDALKAAEVSYSAENVSVHANYATHTNSPINSDCKIVQSEWNGEGLPPVGTVCEWKEKTGFSWVKATVLFITDSSVVMQREDGFEWQMLTKRTVFRPIRTTEQIAAEERTNNAIAMCQATQGAHDWMEAFRMLHDAGYRKFEIVDN